MPIHSGIEIIDCVELANKIKDLDIIKSNRKLVEFVVYRMYCAVVYDTKNPENVKRFHENNKNKQLDFLAIQLFYSNSAIVLEGHYQGKPLYMTVHWSGKNGRNIIQAKSLANSGQMSVIKFNEKWKIPVKTYLE